jgi:hypothetical protein
LAIAGRVAARKNSAAKTKIFRVDTRVRVIGRNVPLCRVVNRFFEANEEYHSEGRSKCVVHM